MAQKKTNDANRDKKKGGVFANPFSDGTSLKVLVEVEDLTSHAGATSGAGAGADATVALTLRDTDGKVVAHAQATVHPKLQPQTQTQTHPDDGTTSTGATNLSATSSVLVEMKPDTALQTWSMQTPATYILTAAVGDDTINITVAVRTFDYKGPKAKLNGNTIELQGFSHHPSFAGMGAMTNPRLALFMVQTTKALGVNFWRNSHNPYEDAAYELLTTSGVMCWDENRNFGSWHVS